VDIAMIRFSKLRLAAVFALATIVAGSPASAQTTDWKYDKLNDLLQRRFSVPGAAPTPSRPEPNQGTRSLQQIAPEQQEQKYHQLEKEDQGRASPRPLLRGQAADTTVAPTERTRGFRAATRSPALAAGAVQPVEQVPVAKPNSYVIQLKPDTTGAQLDALLAKYKLRIVSDELIKLGSLIVEQAAAPEEANRARSFNKIEDVLEPKIIRDLRREPAVKEAFVNSVVGPKWVPKPVATQVPIGDKIYKWRWGKADAADGNWGLKQLRMPTVWAILKSWQAKHTGAVSPVVGIIDSGFGKNDDIDFTLALDTPLARALPGAPPCDAGHGTHVAGIVGAKFDNAVGIDGAAPNVGLEVVGVKADFVLERPLNPGSSPAEAEEIIVDTVLMQFTDVMKTATKYVVANLSDTSRLRVVNLSLAYNWYRILGKKNPADNRALQRHIASEAALFKTLAELAQERILFVVAAGNDSRGWDVPLEAKWASSIAWAGTHEAPQSKPSPNILVVEAYDRDGKRADFSNRGGHVAAPGVEIMSTALSQSGHDFALCSGTSQAAPHVAAIAALLFEIAPDKKPGEIADIIKKTALPSGQKYAAAQLDPLEAVLESAPDALGMLADLSGDGAVDKKDLMAFKDRMDSLRLVAAADQPMHSLAASTEPSGPADRDGDGVPDGGQVWWPRADLNGSGLASFEAADLRPVCKAMRTDLDIIKLAWQDQAQSFDQAVAELQLTNPSAMAAATPAGPTTVRVRSAQTRSLVDTRGGPCAAAN
jgi:Subtilase family